MEEVIKLNRIGKSYTVYDKTIDMVKEALSPFHRNLHSSFHALQDINISIKKGEIVGFIGKNGAGKSTLLKIITGVLEPTSGERFVKGKVTALLELGTAFNPELTGIENIYIYGSMMGLSRKEMEHQVNSILEFADIGDFINMPMKTYSSGMYSRLAFSAAIHVKPDILIADEILSVGDTEFQNKCIEHMKKMVNSGVTVLFVSHDLHSIKFFCDRVIRLHKGMILEDSRDIINVIDNYQQNIFPSQSDPKHIQKSTDMVEIYNTYLVDKNGERRNVFSLGEDFAVIVNYRINKTIENAFFGIGFRNSNNHYVSGMNTKLDKFYPLLTNGEHTLKLQYKNVNLYKDTFTLWSVCYNSSGTVVLANYIIQNAFKIVSQKELCEGIVMLEHEWMN